MKSQVGQADLDIFDKGGGKKYFIKKVIRISKLIKKVKTVAAAL